MKGIRKLIAVLTLATAALTTSWASAQPDPLPGWNDGKSKAAILAFVRKVTLERGPDFVPPAERIATFDNDGTLWAEKPIYFQAQFALDEIRSQAAATPALKSKEPFRTVLAGDLKALMADGNRGLGLVLARTHSGMTTEAFSRSVAEWLETARHPQTKRRYTEMVYQPQLELLAYLRANGFKTFIVSGGGVEFMRVFADKAYGIPPEQVVGSSGVVKFRLGKDGKPELIKEAKVEFVDDGPGKPVGINRFIGRRPIFAFGNSDGDLQMLQYTVGGSGPRMALIVHHTDAEREWAYDRKSEVGKLDKALDEAAARGWTIVDMKNDWKTVFPPPP
ncbi:HAD family hydrolase [Bosea sp. TAF32]|uniref:HAD family hydrolase n=1 Tax=Bosea sp. TAF32 TaxID=3237482 RepID=UPI003F8FAB19